MVPALRTENGFVAGAPFLLFEDVYYLGAAGQIAKLDSRAYDVASDGRFLMIKGPHSEPAGPMDVVLVQNWFEELKRLVPVD